ncbi:uncharacterized protein LOC127286546 isoform X2 [Leptopilina boulardi]|uniref:uncharacterized protein LOC127286546 isoform X2 n=1 Tax=Leptopilina boulardi TaxID=63433 RepID=UPI0021F520DC|nr:uncharacterized protein LOC127286546 isoform X2 [Leptopilina boulardi]
MRFMLFLIFAVTFSIISISTDAHDADVTDKAANLQSRKSEQDNMEIGYQIHLLDKNDPTYSGNNSIPSDSLVYKVFAGYQSGNEMKEVTPQMRQYKNGNIIAGAGYSGDTQQIVPQVCYNATVSSTSEQQAYIQLDTSISYLELESKLGISVSISGKYEMFSAEAKASYIRSVQDRDYATSLNYYEYATNNVAVQLAGYGDKALTESGKGFYNDGKNPYFGLLCGDHYITSYQQGALLIMGLNIKFSNSQEKKEFEAKVGTAFGNIVSAAEKIQSISTMYKISGSVVIQAFQIGGEPSQISKILNKDSTGQYYALTCSLLTMANCIKAASGLLDYGKDEFSKQFSFKNNTGLTPLGIAFSQYYPIEYIGLISPASLVTTEVIKYRDELTSKLKENDYYQQKLYPFFNMGYPIELEAAFVNNANSVLSKANNNIRILMKAHKGAADCFNLPDKCKSIKDSIDSQLENITISDLKFLEYIKYTITIFGGMLYNKGRNHDTYSWVAVPNNKPGQERLQKVNYIFITDKKLEYDTDNHIPVTSDLYQVKFTGDINSSGTQYVGTMCSRVKRFDWNPCQRGYPERKLISPFFFEAYNITLLID